MSLSWNQSATDAKHRRHRAVPACAEPAGPGGEVCMGEGEGKGESNSYTGHTSLHAIILSIPFSRYLCYMCGPSSPSTILLEGDQSPTLEDLSRACYSPSLFIFRVPWHAHIHVDDTPIPTPLPLQLHSVPAMSILSLGHLLSLLLLPCSKQTLEYLRPQQH